MNIGSTDNLMKLPATNLKPPEPLSTANANGIPQRPDSEDLESVEVHTVDPLHNLPPELRNRIYDYLSPLEKEILIMSGSDGQGTIEACPPAITRVSKQIRIDTLQLFYSSNKFVCPVWEFNFTALVHWINCITTGPAAPRVHIRLLLIDRIVCAYDIMPLVRAWRDVYQTNVQLSVDKESASLRSFPHLVRATGLPSGRHPFNQKAHVLKAIEIAEDLRRRGIFCEGGLRRKRRRHFERIDREYLGACIPYLPDTMISAAVFHQHFRNNIASYRTVVVPCERLRLAILPLLQVVLPPVTLLDPQS